MVQPELQPLLRWFLFLLLCASGWCWSRRRFGTAAALFLAAQGGAIVFWTAQMREPIGMDSAPVVQEIWARIRVAHEHRDPGLGYVAGTRAPATLLTRVAAAGLNPGLIKGAFAAAPAVLVLALAFAASCVAGSPARRWLTMALAGTSAPLWSLIVDLPAGALARPEAAWIASLILVALVASSRLLAFGRRAWWLAGLIALSLVAGMAFSGETALVRASPFDWLGLAAAPVAALLLVPALRSLALALRSAPLGRTRVEAIVMVSIGVGSSWLWWEPARTIRGFDEACAETSALDAPLDWLRSAAPAGGTIASSPPYAALVSEHTGRQTLMAVSTPGQDADRPYRRARLLESLFRGQPDASLVAAFGVTHLLVGPGDPDPPEGSLRRVYEDENDFRVYELPAPPGSHP